MRAKSFQAFVPIACRIGVILVVMMAIALSAARILLPLAKNHKDFWEVELTTWIGKPVRINHLDARMVGMSPVLVVSGVQILSSDAQRVLLNARKIRLALDTFKLFARGKLQPRWLSVVGAQLKARRKVNGTLSLVGLKSSDEFPHWLFEKGHFELIDSTVEWQDRKRQIRDFKLTGVDASIVNQGLWHTVSISLALPDGLGEDVDIIARFRGDTTDTDCCTGRFYSNLANIHFDKLIVRPPINYLTPGPGSRGGFRVWGEFASSRLEKVSGWFDFVNLSVYRQRGDASQIPPIAPLKDFDGWFSWHPLSKGWRLALNKFSLTVEDKPWRRSDLEIIVEAADAADRVKVKSAVSYLRIEDVRRFALESIPLEAKYRSTLEHLAPSGEIQDLEVTYETPQEGVNKVSACGKFDRLTLKAWGKIPGFSNLRGRLCGDSDAGELEILANAGQVVAPKLFRRALPFRSINGKVSWMQSARAWHFVSRRTTLDTPDINTHNRFHLTVPISAKAPFLDLQTGFSDGIAARTGGYLPAKIMRENLVAWLDKAFVSGRIGQGGVLVHGPVDRFPFKQADGVFEAWFDVHAMELAYQSNWPHMKELDAELRFERDSFSVRSKRGRLSGANMENVLVTIDDIGKADRLTASGEAHGKISQTIDFLHNSPLKQRVDPITEFVGVEGENRIKTDLVIPLISGRDAEVHGSVQISDGKMKVANVDLDFDQISGELTFDNKGVAAKDLGARLFDIPARINIRRKKEGALVRVDTKLNNRLLAGFLSEPMRSAFSGESDLTARVWIPNPEDGRLPSTRIAFESDLRGLKLAIPEPLGKAGNSSRQLAVQLSLADKQRIPVTLRYADLMSARLRFSEPNANKIKFEGGELIIGNSPLRRIRRPGLSVVCRLEELQLAPWFDWFESKAAGTASFPLDVRVVQFDVGNLSWDAIDLGKMSANLRHSGTGWRGEIDGRLGKGIFRFPEAGNNVKVLSADLDHLWIPDLSESTLRNGKKLDFEPDLLSGLRVNSKKLIWRSIDLGEFQLRTQSQPAILKIEKLALKSEKHSIDLSGNWRYSRERDWSEAKGTFKSEDLGDFLDRAGWSHAIRDSPAKVTFRLNWSDKFHWFAPETLSGRVNIKLGRGRLLDVEPGIGRALGALNPDTLLRRLRLDFRDLYEEGFAYDSAQGSFKISKGNAMTEDFVIDAVSSRILAAGRTGLLDNDFDQIITVIPKASAGLPIAGAIAGGPAVGAAVFLAQKLIGDRLDTITSTQYSLTGSWDDPIVTHLPGNGGILRKAWSGFKDLPWPEFNEKSNNETTKE